MNESWEYSEMFRKKETVDGEILNVFEQQEMNEFLGFAENKETLCEEIQMSDALITETGKYIPGQIQEITAETVEYDKEMSELANELNTWSLQTEKMSCAVACQTMAVNQLEQCAYTEESLIEIGEKNKWYDAGTCPEDVGKIAEYLGMDVKQYKYADISELKIANDPEIKVLANVDSTILHYPECSKRCQPDHCVQVLRMEETSKGTVVILNDPGHENGCGAVYPLEIFNRACNGDITIIRKEEMV